MLTGKSHTTLFPCIVACVALFGPTTTAAADAAPEALAVSANSHSVMANARTWTDATGQFAIDGQLFQVGEFAVRILKVDGRTCALPIGALSEQDRQFLASYALLAPHNDRLDTAAGLETLLRGSLQGPSIPDESKLLGKLRVSGALMDRLFASPFSRQRRVNETIVGTPVSGHSHTVGRARVELWPDASQAVFFVPIEGAVTSHTTGYAGPVRVHSRGYSPFQSSVRVELDHRGIRVLPGQASATTQTTITGISTSYGPLLGGIVKRAAQRRIAASHSQAEAEAARIVERQINETVTTETDNSMGNLRRLAGLKITDLRSTAERFGVYGRFSTTPNDFFISLIGREGMALPTTSPPTLKTFDESAFVAQLHVSLVEKAMDQADQLDTVAPVVERLLAKNLEPIVKAQEFFKKGSVDMQWSDDEQWLTITWMAK